MYYGMLLSRKNSADDFIFDKIYQGLYVLYFISSIVRVPGLSLILCSRSLSGVTDIPS